MMLVENNRWIAIAVLTLAAVLGIARAQTIKLPDFRERPAVSTAPAGPCDECAVVRSIREIHRRRDAAAAYPTSSVASASSFDTRVVGAVAVIPFGPGSTANSPYVGGVGTPEMNERFGDVSYELTLRMDSGSFQVVERRDGAHYRVGDWVRLSDGRLELLATDR
jgi:hypothetical protein